MKRWGALTAALVMWMVVVCLPASAQYQRAFGWCEQGGQRAKTNGVQSSTYVQQSYVACTVTVYLTGTTTLATIFNDSAHTLPLANPFTATSHGFWAFYASPSPGIYDVQFSGAGITSPFSIAGYNLTNGGGGGGGSGTVGPGTTNRLSKFTSATTIGNSVCSDDGINPTVCPGFSLSTNALFFVKPNNVSTGTTANLLVARDGTASQSVQNAQTTDTDNVIGIAGFGAGTSGSVSVAFSGQFPCTFDNQTAVGDWIILGSGSQCHDAGASQPAGIETVGRVNSVNSGTGTLAGVDLGMPDVTSTSTGGGTGVVSTVVCTGPLGTYTAPGNTITGDCNTSDDGAGNLSATSYTATGTSAGFFASQQGTAPSLVTPNANYFYADTSVVNTFGTAWPSAPGTLGQALVVTSVPDATHIKLGYSSAGCAEGTCVVNTPAGDQVITGAHALTMSNAGANFTDRGLGWFGPDSSGLLAQAQAIVGPGNSNYQFKSIESITSAGPQNGGILALLNDTSDRSANLYPSQALSAYNIMSPAADDSLGHWGADAESMLFGTHKVGTLAGLYTFAWDARASGSPTDEMSGIFVDSNEADHVAPAVAYGVHIASQDATAAVGARVNLMLDFSGADTKDFGMVSGDQSTLVAPADTYFSSSHRSVMVSEPEDDGIAIAAASSAATNGHGTNAFYGMSVAKAGAGGVAVPFAGDAYAGGAGGGAVAFLGFAAVNDGIAAGTIADFRAEQPSLGAASSAVNIYGLDVNGFGGLAATLGVAIHIGSMGTATPDYAIKIDGGKNDLGPQPTTVGSLKTTANCSGVGTAANPSVATCAAAAAGSFSCATAATGGTCTVNTTAVTANSQIFVTEDETLGTKLGVTCNTSTTVIPTSRLLAARVAATSFTINLGTVTTNPACFSYFIVN